MPQLPLLRVTADNRGLEYAEGPMNGRPFIYFADTVWELFHRLTLDEAKSYLDTRREQGFNAYQAVALAELDGLNEPNRNGDCPLIDNDPTRPNEVYWKHVDAVIDYATSLGLYTVLLPTWGDKWNDKWGVGPLVFNPDNAYVYARLLAQRYGRDAIIWMLGGDREIANDTHLGIIRAMAKGIRDVVGDEQLITFHPSGRATSAKWLHDEPWLDFNTLQSGHHDRDYGNWRMIAADYAREPAKPCLDSEPNYEDHPVMGDGWKPTGDWFTDHDCRKSAWRALLNGACGHTYGCHDIWQCYDPARHPAVNNARTPWPEAVHIPGAAQCGAIIAMWRSLVSMSRPEPAADRIKLVDGDADDRYRPHVAVAQNGSFAVIYAPGGGSATWSIDLPDFPPSADVMRHDPVTLDVADQLPLNGTSLTISGTDECLWLVMRDEE